MTSRLKWALIGRVDRAERQMAVPQRRSNSSRVRAQVAPAPQNFLSWTRCVRPAAGENDKGPAVSGQALALFGGANRDRTDDLYNAIVREGGFLLLPQNYPSLRHA